jgi:beta-glucanase (GH16 family)
MWPYSYSSCDIGILPNQSADGINPEVAFTTGDPNYNNTLSYLPGQRLSSCNCPGYDHPGPEGVGRGAVEIDMIEAQMDLTVQRGMVSQSAQVAPYDDYYQFDNSTDAAIIYDDEVTRYNTYLGSVYQQAVSGLSYTETRIYSNESAEFGVFGFEYYADYDDDSKGYITWINMGKRAWTMWAKSVGPNPRSGVGQRLISQEPMYLIFNLGMSNNFERVDFANLMLPNEMRIDYIRVYQKPGVGTIGCDPAGELFNAMRRLTTDRPTAAYIEKYKELYNNPNITIFPDPGELLVDYWQARPDAPASGREFPKNRMTHPNC